MKTLNENSRHEFTISHQFNAPKKLVFNAFSSKRALGQWWGPVESKNTALKLDFRTGGTFHYKMDNGHSVSYGRFTFGEIRPYDLLEFTNSFADEKGNIVPAPFTIPLPLAIFYRLVFSESNGKTTITLTGKPINATKEEVESFLSIQSSMEAGFAGTFNRLSEYLKQDAS